MEEQAFDLKPVRRVFSRIGLALCAVLVIGTVLQVLWFVIPQVVWGEDNWLSGSSWGIWLGTFLPLYLAAIPVGVGIMAKLPAEAPRENKLGGKNFVIFFLMCVFLMYAGNLIGTLLSALLSGGTAQNAVVDYAMDTNPLKVLFVVILAPTMEELVFRKQLLDRTRQYGEKTAALLSALTFGLLHQNLFQFFYAFALGYVFAYIYLRTGRLRYSALLHSIVNFMGSVLAPWVLTRVDLEALSTMDPNAAPEVLLELYRQILPELALLLGYGLTLIGLSIAGLVLVIIKGRKLIWKEGASQLPAGTAGKAVYGNMGMVLYMLLCLVTTVISLL